MTTRKRARVQEVPVPMRAAVPVTSDADLHQQHAEATAQLVVFKTASPRSADAIAAQKQVIQRLAEQISQRAAAASIT